MAYSALNLPGKLFRHSTPDRPPLRLGLRVDGPAMSAWAQAVVQDLLLSDFILIEDVQVVTTCCWRSQSVSGAIVHALFRGLDEAYRLKDDPLAPRRVPPSLKDRRSDTPLDVCLNLSSCGDDWQSSSRHGVWTLQMGDPAPNPAWPPFGREMVRGDALRRVELVQRRSYGLSSQRLGYADFPCNPYPSARLNLIGPLWGASHLFLQKLNELHRFGAVAIDGTAVAESAVSASVEPGLVEVFRWLSRQATKGMFGLFRRHDTRRVWHLAIRRSSTPLVDSPTDEAIRSFRWMRELEDCEAADPFLFEEGGRLWLFFESIDRHSGHGHIACGWLDGAGQLREVRAALKLSTHLSYPHLIRDRSQIYLLPESSDSGGLDLYRARRFPDEWEKVCRVLDFPCVDSTVFQHDSAWWMFTSPKPLVGEVAITWIFKAERLEGPWEYQFSGPASCSALTARAAGEVFKQGGRLIRPSQDCGHSYGRAIVFNEIQSLDSGIYQERTLSRVESKPLPGLVGLHTYNRCGEWEVIDGLFADGHQPPENPIPASRQARDA